MLAEGNSVKEISILLGLSAKTVEVHKSTLMEKIGCHNKVQLVMYAVRHKLVPVSVRRRCEAAMKLKIEQLDSSVKGRVIRKTYKRRNAKLNRRLAKADLENASTKPRYRGYVS